MACTPCAHTRTCWLLRSAAYKPDRLTSNTGYLQENRDWQNHTLQILRPSTSKTTSQINGLQVVQGGLVTASNTSTPSSPMRFHCCHTDPAPIPSPGESRPAVAIARPDCCRREALLHGGRLSVGGCIGSRIGGREARSQRALTRAHRCEGSEPEGKVSATSPANAPPDDPRVPSGR